MKKYIVAVAAFVALLMGTTPAFAGAELGVDAFSRHVWRGQAGPASISVQPTLDLVSVDTNVGATSVSIWGQIPVMGDDNTEYTSGYCKKGSIPIFKLIKLDGNEYWLEGNIDPWKNNELFISNGLNISHEIPSAILLKNIYPQVYMV